MGGNFMNELIRTYIEAGNRFTGLAHKIRADADRLGMTQCKSIQTRHTARIRQAELCTGIATDLLRSSK